MEPTRAAVRTIQGAVAVIVVWGLLSGNVVLAVNGLLGLGVAFAPEILTRTHGVRLDGLTGLWIAVVVFLHTLGMAGPYETIQWWDHLTHTLSAALVATIGYAAVREIDKHDPGVSFPPLFRFVAVVVFTIAAGVSWEVLEFLGRVGARSLGQQPILVQYGLTDTVLDLVFDVVGAILAALLQVHTHHGSRRRRYRGLNRKSP